ARPVSVLYGSEYDNEIFCITLNDQRIQQQARFIKVVFDDQQEVTTPLTNQEGAIISRHTATSHSNYQDVIIYDVHNVELFRSSLKITPLYGLEFAAHAKGKHGA